LSYEILWAGYICALRQCLVVCLVMNQSLSDAAGVFSTLWFGVILR